MDPFTGFLHFLGDKSKSIGLRFGSLMAILVIILLLDHFTGYSYFMWKSNQLDQIAKIEKIKNDYPGDSYFTLQLDIMEEELFSKNRNIIVNYFTFSRGSKLVSLEAKRDSILSAFAAKSDTSSLTFTVPDSANKKNVKSPKISNNVGSASITVDYWHILTSSYSLVIILITIPFVPIATKSLDFHMITGIIVIMILIILLIWLFSFAVELIQPFDTPWKRYLFNFIFHTCYLIVFGIIAKAVRSRLKA